MPQNVDKLLLAISNLLIHLDTIFYTTAYRFNLKENEPNIAQNEAT